MNTKTTTRRGLVFLSSLLFLALAVSAAAQTKSVEAGSSWVVDKTTQLTGLTLGQGAKVTPPEGSSVTLTVDGVETGLQPGDYKGKIVLTVTDANIINFSKTLIHPFRHALYLDATGVVASKSVLAAAGNFTTNANVLSGPTIRSVGENFNGIYAVGGTNIVKNAVIDFKGDGGNDFAGFGAFRQGRTSRSGPRGAASVAF